MKKTQKKQQRISTKPSLSDCSSSLEDQKLALYLSDLCPVCFESLHSPKTFLQSPRLQILSCKTCGLQVHGCCYGTPNQNTQDFQCDICLFKQLESPKCLICSNDNKLISAFKRLGKDLWVHAVCGLNASSVMVVDFISMQMKLLGHSEKNERSERNKKVKTSADCCYICSQSSPSHLLFPCDQCRVKAHPCCIFLEQAFRIPDDLPTSLLYFRFSPNPAAFDLCWASMQELLIEDCQAIRHKVAEAVEEYGPNQVSKGTADDPIVALRELKQKIWLLKEESERNSGFRCEIHEECVCTCEEKTSNNAIFCEYCTRWFHFECSGVTVEPEDFFCSTCLNNRDFLQSLLQLFQSRSPEKLASLKELNVLVRDCNAKMLDLVILASEFNGLLKALEGKEDAWGEFIPDLVEFATKMPINTAVLLMSPIGAWMKRRYWDSYLLPAKLKLPDIVRPCLEIKENEPYQKPCFNPDSSIELQNLVLQLRLIDQENTENSLKFSKNPLIDDLEDIWNAQQVIRKLVEAEQASEEDLALLKRVKTRFPKYIDFETLKQFGRSKDLLLEDLKTGVLTQILGEQEAVRAGLTLKKTLLETLEPGFFKLGKTSFKLQSDLLKKLGLYSQLSVLTAEESQILNNFLLKMRSDEKEAITNKNYEFYGLNLYKSRLWSEDSFESFNKWLRFKCLSRKLRLFFKIHSQTSLAPYIWSPPPMDPSSTTGSPLLRLCQSILLTHEPQIPSLGLPLYRFLSLDFIRELLSEAAEIQENEPKTKELLNREVNQLNAMLENGTYLQKTLEKAYYDNVLQLPMPNLLQNLSILNLFLPIFPKISNFSKKSHELERLKAPQTAIMEVIGELEVFMVRKLGMLEVDELVQAGKVAKRLKRLINIVPNTQKYNPWVSFAAEVHENLTLYRGVCSLFMTPQGTAVEALKEKAQELQDQLENPEKAGFANKSSSSEPETLRFQRLYQEIDRNPELNVILKGFNEVLLELRIAFWLLKLQRMGDFPAVEDFTECQRYLRSYLEKPASHRLKHLKPFENFKLLEQKVDSWLEDYQNMLAFLLSDQSLLRAKVDEIAHRLNGLKSKMPVRIGCCASQLESLCLAFEAAGKVKKTLALMGVEGKKIAFSCIETLYEFFFDQSSQTQMIFDIVPFSQELSIKYLELTGLKGKIRDIYGFFRKKRELFKSHTLKASEANGCKLRNSTISAVFLFKRPNLDVNPIGVYDFYQEHTDYQSLREIIEKTKSAGIDLSSERAYLNDIKQNTESEMLEVDRRLKINPMPGLAQVWTEDTIGNYLHGIFNHRNSLFNRNVVHCRNFESFRLYEWVFYALCTLDSQLWLLEESTNEALISEQLRTLSSFLWLNSSFDESLEGLSSLSSPMRAMNEFSRIRKLLSEGEKNSLSFEFSSENREVLQLVRGEVLGYENWSREHYEEYRRKYEGMGNLGRNNDRWLGEDLKVVIDKMLSCRIFEREKLGFLAYQVQEAQEVRSFWIGMRNLKSLKGIPEEKVLLLFWLKDFEKIGFFVKLCQICRVLKRLLLVFKRKPTSGRYTRLLEFYNETGLVVPEIEETKEQHFNSLMLVEEISTQFEQALKESDSCVLWESLARLKRRLLEQVGMKFIRKYQTLWFEVLENQVLCLRQLFAPKKAPVRRKKKFQEKIEFEGEATRPVLKVSELREIEKESQNLSKPNRDFLGNFLKRKQGYVNNSLKWPLTLINDECSEEFAQQPQDIKLIGFKRTRNLLKLKVILNNISDFGLKKSAAVAEFLENKLFKKNPQNPQYEQKFDELMDRIRTANPENMWEILGIRLRKNKEDLLKELKKGFEAFTNGY